MGAKRIFGMSMRFPLYWLAMISATIRWGQSSRTMRRVPLHTPFLGHRFLSSMIDEPTCKWFESLMGVKIGTCNEKEP